MAKSYLTALPDKSFFTRCAFICVDLQENDATDYTTPQFMADEDMPEQWKADGFAVEDVNDAIDFAFHVCNPNAAKATQACRELGLPMIFIHWGSRYEDLMDMDPEIRQMLIKETVDPKTGETLKLYPPSAKERPAAFLNVQPGEYVLSKTAQDAFLGTPLYFMLQNLGIENLVLIGGHTGACLGKTSKTAKKLGFRTLCVADATNNAFESNRIARMLECEYDYIVTTDDFVAHINVDRS